MNGSCSFRLRASAAAVVCAVAYTGVAGAEDAAEASAAPPGAEPVTTRRAERSLIEELIVTAQRRTDSLQNTAIAATVLTGEELLARGVDGLTALQFAAPGITISDYGSANVFNVRGIGRSQVDVDLPSGVVIYRDGVPTLAGYFQNEPYFDIGSIEVLRGPQGTFVGKSASGGAVFISTANPQLDEFDASVEVGAGNYERFEATAVVNAPLGETVAIRAAYHHMQRDHYFNRITGPYTGDPGTRDLHSLRLSLLWEPTDQWELLLKADYSDLDFGGNVTSAPGAPLFDVHQDAPFAYKDESLRTVMNVRYTFENGISATSMTGIQDLKTINNLDLNGAVVTPSYWFQSRAEFDFYSQEFNLISPDDQSFRWVIGLFAQRQEGEIPYWQRNGFTFTGGPFFPNMDFPWITSPWSNKEDDLAAFAHLAFDLTEGVELEIGTRYSRYKRSQFTEWTLGNGLIPPTIPFGSPGGDRQSLSENSLDWKIALNWQYSPEHFLYALVARGHTTGGLNLFPPFLDYDEMEVIDYELGWKATWLEGRFLTQVGAYYQTFDNYQANFQQVGSEPAVSTFRNAESESIVWGIEASGQAQFGNLGLDFGIAYLDSELGRFSDVLNPFPGPALIDLSGAKSPFSPEITGNIGAGYELHLPNGATLTPRLDVAHIGKTQAGLFPSSQITLEDRTLVNANIRFDAGPWRATLWSTNLLNERYVAGIQNNGTLYYPAPRRMYGLRVQHTF
jgi:iron complex outermembrane recepter protein